MGLPGSRFLRLDLLNERDNRIAYSLDALRLLSGIDFRPYPWLLAEVEPGFTITNLECADPDVDCGQDLDGNQNTRLRLDRGQRTGFNLGSQITVDFRNSPFNRAGVGVFDSEQSMRVVSSKTKASISTIPTHFLNLKDALQATCRSEILCLRWHYGGAH